MQVGTAGGYTQSRDQIETRRLYTVKFSAFSAAPASETESSRDAKHVTSYTKIENINHLFF